MNKPVRILGAAIALCAFAGTTAWAHDDLTNGRLVLNGKLQLESLSGGVGVVPYWVSGPYGSVLIYGYGVPLGAGSYPYVVPYVMRADGTVLRPARQVRRR